MTTNTVVPEIKSTRYRMVIVAILLIAIAVAYMDRVNVSILIANEQFLLDMGITGQPMRIGMLMSVFLMAYGLSNALLGWMGDYLGVRKAMLISVMLWVISLLIGGWAPSFAMMLVARVLLGIGEGFYYPLQSIMVKQWIPPAERGKANAAWSIGQSIAPALAMPFISYVVALWGWRESFHILVPITIIPIILLYFFTTDTPAQNRHVNAAELELIESSLREEQQEVTGQTFWQRFRPIMGNYNYWLLVSWYLSLNLIYWGLIAWLPSYLKEVRGFSWVEVGWLASLPFVFTIITKAYSGWIVDKMGRSAPILMLGMFMGALCIYLATVVHGKYPAALLLACTSAFTSMGLPASWTLLQSLVPTKAMGISGGVMVGLSTGISSISPMFIGAVIQLTGSYSGGLYLLIGTALCAGLAASVLVLRKY